MKLTFNFALATLFTLSSATASATSTQQGFFDNIKSHCGKAYQGRITEDSANDQKLAKQVLTMHVRKCSDNKLEVPFHIGDNASRTWVLTRDEHGITLAHDHRHKDGSSDKVTMYGGKTKDNGTEFRQSFPANQYSKTLFLANQLSSAVDNTWHMEITADSFKYQLIRPNRVFTAEFDLSTEVKTPPTPWGH